MKGKWKYKSEKRRNATTYICIVDIQICVFICVYKGLCACKLLKICGRLLSSYAHTYICILYTLFVLALADQGRKFRCKTLVTYTPPGTN